MAQQNQSFIRGSYRQGHGMNYPSNESPRFQDGSLRIESTAMARGLSDDSNYSITTNNSDSVWSEQSWNTNPTATSPMSTWEEFPALRIKGEENAYTWDDNADNIKYSPAGSQGFQTPMPQPSFTESTIDPRPTPTSLNWNPHSRLLEIYKFVVGKGGKDPYFQLLDGCAVTEQTPARVFLDYPKSQKKGAYPCQYPWGCSGKQTVFTRPADLERHYKNVHAPSDQRDSFCCDYPKCGRATEAFTRKDHYRDHLRDYHKEDLGCAKAQKKLGRRDPAAAEQAAWLAERKISSRWWRCARCLVRRQVAEDGWECPTCKVSCEQERIDARMSQSQHHRNAALDTAEVGVELGYQTIGTSASTATASGTSTFYNCGTCHDKAYPGWIDNGMGAWVPCPECSPRSTAETSSSYSGSNYYS